MGTLRQAIKEMIGYRLIPENYVVLIERDGQAVRLEGPGYIRLKPLSENFGPMMRVGFYTTQLSLPEVRSADGVPFNIQAKLAYSFEPYCCNQQVAFYLIRNGPDALSGLVQNVGSQAVRHLAGGFTSVALRSGQNLQQLDWLVWRKLRRGLLPYGIFMPQSSNVAITQISPPTHLENTCELATEQKIIANALEAIPAKVADRMAAVEIINKLTTSGNSIQIISSLADFFKLPLNLPWNDTIIQSNGHQKVAKSDESGQEGKITKTTT